MVVKRTRKAISDRLRGDLSLLAKSALAFLLAGYFSVSMISFTKGSINQAPLSDVGFRLIPYVDCLWLTDAAVYFLIVASLAWVVLFGHSRRPLRIIAGVLIKLSICYTLRSMTIFVTSLPDPRPTCRHVDGDLYSILTNFSAHRCGDCIFSGHTVIMMTFGHVWFKQKSILKYPLMAASLFGVYAILANRAHYTVDVILAVYITLGVSFFVDHRLANKKFE